MKTILVFSTILALNRINLLSVLSILIAQTDINKYHYIALIATLLLTVIICLYQNKCIKAELKLISEKNARLEGIIALKAEAHSQALSSFEALADSTDKRFSVVAKFVSFINHDVHAPLKYLSFSAEKIPDLITSDELEEVSKVSKFICDISDRMSIMLDRLTPLIKAQLQDSQRKPTVIDIHELINEKSDIIKSKIRGNTCTLRNNIAPGECIEANPEFLSIIVENLLTESVRYATHGHQMEVSFKHVDASTGELTIANTLPSVPESILTWLNTPVDETVLKNLFRHDHIDCLSIMIVNTIASLGNITVRADITDSLRFHILLTKPA